MCGLVGRIGGGLFGFDPEAMLDLIAHRGPDGRGYADCGGALLGHTRLAIQDAAGHGSDQPFVRGPITLTYNGEVWNPDALGIADRETTGDTEVVAAMLEQDGTDALDELVGMWAMAWHDARDGLIRLAVDRYGKVPLYYRAEVNEVAWASEYGALPAGGSPEPVLPGQLITIDPTTLTVTRGWWKQDEPLDLWEPTPSTILELLRSGVRERLVGDRPIAFMLSGGLDSSLILALAKQEYAGEIVAYTAVGDLSSQDLLQAEYVAGQFEVELVHVPVPEVTYERIEEAVRVVEIPMKAQVEIALAHLPVVQAMASDGFAVCLSGEAADELFGGYGGMQIKAASADDEGYRQIKSDAVAKMARGNFPRVNKVGMRYGVECRLPFMQEDLVRLAIRATKDESPPGKKLLKDAAFDLVPERIIHRPKATFQGGVGTADAASHLLGGIVPVQTYNRIARETFGHLPRS